MMSATDKTTRPAEISPGPASEPPEESTGLPWFRSWRAVYLFVLGCFVLYVIGLVLVSHVFA